MSIAKRRKRPGVRRPRLKSTCEECWVVVGQRRGSIWHGRRVEKTSGEVAQVEFDGAWVLEREEKRGDVVGFYHTHPSGTADPSRRDLDTMHAWASAFGKPLLCLIESSAELAAYRFDDDESAGERLELAEAFPRGVVVAVEAVDGIEEEDHDE